MEDEISIDFRVIANRSFDGIQRLKSVSFVCNRGQRVEQFENIFCALIRKEKKNLLLVRKNVCTKFPVFVSFDINVMNP